MVVKEVQARFSAPLADVLGGVENSIISTDRPGWILGVIRVGRDDRLLFPGRYRPAPKAVVPAAASSLTPAARNSSRRFISKCLSWTDLVVMVFSSRVKH